MKRSDNHSLDRFRNRVNKTLDAARVNQVKIRHAKGYRTARENLYELVDKDSFLEYGQLAIAAQRNRKPVDELIDKTPADGIITGIGHCNSQYFSEDKTQIAVIVNDYTVLAGTQGYFHHKKLDRILEVVNAKKLPVIMFTEGGGGRPGDTDVATQIAGLNITSFAAWAALHGVVPRIAVANGYCFAGNASLFGCADIRIATKNSWIGMAGPAMIEGGGLGSFSPTEIGPIDVQAKNGVVDIVANNEEHASQLAKQVMSYFQGDVGHWEVEDQAQLQNILPDDRRFTYKVREIIQILADKESFIETQSNFGKAIITGFLRIEGKAFGLLCNDCKVIAGAINAEAADKAARFIQLCDSFKMPILTLCDTPGFMVGPDSEKEAAVAKTSELFIAGAKASTPFVTIFLRKAYGLGAMAMAGGSFLKPVLSAAWPTGEFGGMGLEGAVRLGFKNELNAIEDEEKRETYFNQLVAEAYQKGQAIEAAAYLEIDAVIDPADTRKMIIQTIG